MPRLNTGLEIYKYLNSITKYVIQPTTPGDTTTTAPVLAGDAVVAVTAITNFTAADPAFVIGDGGVELVIIGTPATSMPIVQKAAIAQSTGARFVEAMAIPLGHIDESGITMGGSFALTPVKSAVSRVAIAYYAADPAELSFGFNLRGWNNLNLQASFGVTESELGAGTSADPYRGLIDGLTVGTQGTQCFRALGVRNDLKNVQVDFLDARVEVSVNTSLGGPQPAILPIALKCAAILQRIW